MMPAKRTLQRARKDRAQGKSLSTQAGEFVREEIRHVREGKHEARNAKQAIAIGLSKTRRASVKLKPNPSNTSPAARRTAAQEMASVGQKPSRKRAKSSKRALKRESLCGVGKRTGSPGAFERFTTWSAGPGSSCSTGRAHASDAARAKRNLV